MKRMHGLSLCLMMASVFLWGFGSPSAFTQQSSSAGQAAANYPSDIHPDTLSRLSMPKRETLDNEEERQAWDRRVKVDPGVFDPFHGTAHRLHLPVVSEHTREVLLWLRAKGPLEPRLKILTQMVAARETENQIEYPANPKDISPEIIDVVKFKKDPKGLSEKEQIVIRFIREMVHGPKVSSKTYADATRLFGERGVLTIVSFTTYYAANAMLFRAYDTRLPAGEAPRF